MSQAREAVPARLASLTPLLSFLALFALALIPRVIHTGGFLTIDEVKWVEGAGQFLLALYDGDLAKTYWHFHPGITITWGEALVLLARCWDANSASLHACVTGQVGDLAGVIGAMRLSPVVINSAAVPVIYLLARRLLPERVALLGGVLLALDPFFVAHSRIVNGDAGAAAFMFISLLSFMLYCQPGSGQRYLIISALAAGLALLTKLPSPLLIPFVVLLALAVWGYDRLRPGHIRSQGLVTWLKVLLIWVGVAVLTVIVLFPALWVAPVSTLRQAYNDSFEMGEVDVGHPTFFGGTITNDPGPWFYPYTIAFRLTPLTILAIILSLPMLALGREDERSIGSGRVLWAYVLFLLAVASLGAKKLDRYLMGVFPALDILAAFGIWAVVDWLTGRWLYPSLRAGRAVGLAVVACCLLLPAWGLWATFPCYLTYYNPLLGGLPRAAQEVPVGWGEGLEQAALYLNSKPDAPALRVAAWYSDIFNPYFVGQRASFSSDGRSLLAADYVVFYINQVQRQKPDPGLVAYFQQRGAEYTVRLNGVEYAWVYRAPAMRYQAKGRAAGWVELLGYNVDNRPMRPGETIPLTIYLRCLNEERPDYHLYVDLVSDDGRDWGTWQEQARGKEEWQPGAVVEWRGILALPADIPPGQYRLEIGGRDAADNTVVYRFKLPDEQGTFTVL
jgi:hypothetical protein